MWSLLLNSLMYSDSLEEEASVCLILLVLLCEVRLVNVLIFRAQALLIITIVVDRISRDVENGSDPIKCYSGRVCVILVQTFLQVCQEWLELPHNFQVVSRFLRLVSFIFIQNETLLSLSQVGGGGGHVVAEGDGLGAPKHERRREGAQSDQVKLHGLVQFSSFF